MDPDRLGRADIGHLHYRAVYHVLYVKGAVGYFIGYAKCNLSGYLDSDRLCYFYGC